MEVATVEAKTLSKEEYEAWVTQAAADEQQIKAGLRTSRSGLWKAAEALYRFSDTHGWMALGYDTLGEWLGDPEITLTRTTYFRMVEAWRELVVVRGLPSPNVGTLDLTKVSIAMRALKAGEASVEDVVADVETLGARDLREKYGAEPQTEAPDLDDLDGDRPDGGEESEEISEDYDPDQYGDETVARGIAETLTLVLESVMRELGSPERKAMSKGLRGQVEWALELAHAEGLGA